MATSKKRDVVNVLEKHVGSWANTGSAMTINAKININENGTFNYISNSCLTVCLSYGEWNVVGDSLFLVSFLPDSCVYIRDFGNDLVLLSEATKTFSKKEVSLINCIPSTFNVFVRFDSSLFVMAKDTLKYIDSDNQIDSLNIYYKK